MLGKGADLEKIARTDFGIIMAWVMSLVNGGLIAGGVFLLSAFDSLCVNVAFAGAIWILAMSVNIYLYHHIVVWKIRKLLPQSKTQAA